MKRLIQFCSFVTIAVNAVLAADPPTSPDVLATAKKIGEDLKSKGYVYPNTNLPASAKTVDCTQFVLKVLEQLVPDLSTATKTRVAMSDLKGADVATDKGGIITSGDSRTKGVQQALVDSGHGTTVPLTDVKAGDLIQYWMKGGDGKWFGHAAVVERVEGTGQQTRAWLYGSHLSKGGIGTAPDVGLRLIASDDRRIYPVRFK